MADESGQIWTSLDEYFAGFPATDLVKRLHDVRQGIRPETLNRIEQGRNKPSVPTIAKIDRALLAAEDDPQ